MPNLTNVALVVHPNEYALLLQELTQPSPGFRESHRYQIIKVVRGDRIATYRKDLGPARNFRGTDMSFIGGQIDDRAGRGKMWHTVAELQAMAEETRDRDPVRWAEENGHEMVVGSPGDWENAYHEEADRRRMAISKKGVSGPFFSKMR